MLGHFQGGHQRIRAVDGVPGVCQHDGQVRMAAAELCQPIVLSERIVGHGVGQHQSHGDSVCIQRLEEVGLADRPP